MNNSDGSPRLVLAAGTTRTARIEGISAAGAEPAARVHTPGADAELLAYGRPVRAPVVPVSPTGCPTPAVVTRAVRETAGFPATVVDAGLAAPTAAPTVDVGARPGGDVRDPEPVPEAPELFRRARELGRGLPGGELLLAETIPGGTTTALATLRALGVDAGVSSSLPENPLARKRRVAAAALESAGLEPPAAPLAALRGAGDPVLAAVAGLAEGALEAGREVTLAGGTQLLAAAAVLRARGHTDPLGIATTRFVAGDPTARFREAAAALDLGVTVTDPKFEAVPAGAPARPVAERYLDGEAKEGAGMGGALALAARRGALGAVRERVGAVYGRLLGGDSGGPGDGPAAGEPGVGEP